MMTHLFKCMCKSGYHICYILASSWADFETQNEQDHRYDVWVANIKEAGK